MKPLPSYQSTLDWPRKVAQAVAHLDKRVTRATDWSALGDYADDAAAAAGGVAVGQLYHTSGAVKVRLV